MTKDRLADWLAHLLCRDYNGQQTYTSEAHQAMKRFLLDGTPKKFEPPAPLSPDTYKEPDLDPFELAMYRARRAPRSSEGSVSDAWRRFSREATSKRIA